jgi:hypothetical protein
MAMSDTTRSRLEDLIREAPPGIKQHADRLAPEGSSLAERAFAFLVARDQAALDRFGDLAETAPKGSDDRTWLAEVCSMLRSDLGLYKESFDLARAMRISALRRQMAATLGRPARDPLAAPARVPPGPAEAGADAPPGTIRRAARRRAGTP